jgi:hypothetical protein
VEGVNGGVRLVCGAGLVCGRFGVWCRPIVLVCGAGRLCWCVVPADYPPL